MFPSYNEAFNATNIPYDQLNEMKAKGKKERIRKLIIFAVIAIISFVLIGIWGSSDSSDLLLYIGIGGLILGAFYGFFSPTKSEEEYKETFKRTVIGPLAENIVKLAQIANTGERHEQKLSYDHNRKLAHSLLDKSQLFNTTYDSYSGEDYFEGQLGLTDFKFSEIHLTNTETTTDSDGNTTTTTTTIFDGLLFVADFKKDFKGFTVLETRSLKGKKGAARLIGNIITSLKSTTNLANAIKIEVENEEFNKTFRVRSNDEIEARYILSSKMIEKLLDFEKSHNYGMAISFSDSYMYIAISSTRNFFDDGIKKNNGQYDVQSVYNDLVFLFSIIEDFELNNRIWSKE